MDNLFDDIDESERPKRKQPSSRRDFANPLEAFQPASVRKATGRGKGRKKYQLTTKIPGEIADDVMAAIKHWADELAMYQNDVQVYALLRGLQALAEGERPEMEEVEVKKTPKLPGVSDLK